MQGYINIRERTKKMRGHRTKEIPAVLIRRYPPVKLPEETQSQFADVRRMNIE